MMRPFHEIADAFQSDGALRDFYIRRADVSDWNAILQHLQWRLKDGCFTVDGVSQELPSTFEEIETIRAQANPCLSILVGGAHVCCHFFNRDTVEFDFRPEDYRTPEAWSELSVFLQDIVDTVTKPGDVTYENAENDVIVRFQPGIQVEPFAPPERCGRVV